MDILDIQKNLTKANDVLDTVDDYLGDGKDKAPEHKIETIIDTDWITGMFMIKDQDLEDIDANYKYFSTASLKFTDTTLGGNIGINARPQFTRYADIRMPGRVINRNPVKVDSKTGGYGMGIYYSEAIDDNSQTVFMEFGVPEFNSLFKFFTRAIDYKTAVLANTGRSTFLYSLGKIVGATAMFIAFPIPSIAVYTLKYLSNALLGSGSFDYYYFKPTMHMYWSSVNTIATMLAIELGILSAVVMDEDSQNRDKIGIPIKIDQKDLDYMREIAPDLITESNYIDVFAIANKSQLIANKKFFKEKALLENGDTKDVDSFITYLTHKYKKEIYRAEGASGFAAWIGDILQLDLLYGKYQPDKDEDSENDVKNIKESAKDLIDDLGKIKINDKKEISFMEQYTKAYEASLKGGGQFATFKVDYVGSVTESFSNSIKDIPTNGLIKSVTGKGRDVNFIIGGGNIVDGLGTIVSHAKDVVAGAVESATFNLSGVLATMLGGAYMDIPKMWDDSSAEFPKLNFTMQLISPYAHPIAQFQNIYLPLSMLLAGGLPLSTGRASYTSPFLCTMFLKGIQHINLGIITDISITRGTSNLPFNKQNKALAIDVSFSVADLSSLVAAPINRDFNNIFSAVFDDDSVFSKYIATLGSRDLRTSIYNSKKTKIRFSRKHLGYEAATSPSFWGNKMGSMDNSILGTIINDYSVNLNFNN